mmetsp:Transcript_27249/g.40234  ORF Transcript_27249/g.40234 Transcript_27249/m.40234 type:complete len:817 (+) Transcript_27249:209-2659(+)
MGCGPSKQAGIMPPTQEPPPDLKQETAINPDVKSREVSDLPDRSCHSAASSMQSDDSDSTGNQNGSTTILEIFDLEKIRDNVKTDCALSGKVIRMETPFGNPIEDIYDGVHSGPILGSGVSGIVRLVTHKATGVKYAVKILDLGLIKSAEGLSQLRQEIYIMCQLDHPNIVRLEEVYESISEIYLVLELCHGGDLFDRLDEQSDYHYTEARCASLVKQMLSSVRYLHSRNIIHRDLKLENFLFSTKGEDSILKMIDFGLSKHFSFGENHSEAVGTPYTVAPEVIKGSYNESCDVWAVGVIAFLLLSGETPFGGVDGEDLMEVRDKILQAEVIFEPADVWDNVSDLARDFVRRTLAKDPAARPTAKEAQRHKWVQTYSKKAKDEGSKLNPNVVGALVSFKEYSDMRKLLCEVLSFTLLPEQINDLRVEFEKMDEGKGEISLADLKQVLLESAESRSLGGMTENEVEDIFNALRVRKSETKIRWHEFIAAGLSQCKVDERNLKLAFDRLDVDRKGYITFDNVIDLVGGTDASENEEEMKRMWIESIRHIKGDLDRITVDQFLLIMKGQALGEGSEKRNTVQKLDVLVEGEESPHVDRTAADIVRFEGSMSDIGINLELPLATESRDSDLSDQPRTARPQPAKDVNLSPETHRPKCSRLRSRSLEHTKTSFFEEDEEDSIHKVPCRALLPALSKRTIESVIGDESKTTLMVNRALYRAHREMRLSVLDASKRFEEKQRRHELKKKREEEGNNDKLSPGIALVMRRSSAVATTGLTLIDGVTAEKNKQQKLIDKASSRAGRPRRTRLRSVSDMTGMLVDS